MGWGCCHCFQAGPCFQHLGTEKWIMVILSSLDQIGLNESGALRTVNVQMRWIGGFWAEREWAVAPLGLRFCFSHAKGTRLSTCCNCSSPGISGSNIVWNNKNLGNHALIYSFSATLLPLPLLPPPPSRHVLQLRRLLRRVEKASLCVSMYPLMFPFAESWEVVIMN